LGNGGLGHVPPARVARDGPGRAEHEGVDRPAFVGRVEVVLLEGSDRADERAVDVDVNGILCAGEEGVHELDVMLEARVNRGEHGAVPVVGLGPLSELDPERTALELSGVRVVVEDEATARAGPGAVVGRDLQSQAGLKLTAY